MSAVEPLSSSAPLECQRRLDLLAQAAQAAWWDWNLVTGEWDYSPEWKNQLGLAGDSLSNQISEWESRLHPEDHDRVMAEVKAAPAKANWGPVIEFRLRHKNGSYRWMALHGQVVRDAAGRPERLLGWQLDITDRRSLEAKFQQLQKMESVGRLAGGVAHDFNNHLTIVLGYSDILLGNPAIVEPTRDSLKEIKKAGERASALTRQLLAFTRKQPLEPAPLDLNVVVEDCEKLMKRLLGEDVELVTSLAPELGRVRADISQTEQVLMNLAINAREAMPQGGKLTIETAAVSLGEAYCRMHAGVNPGRYILLAVSDTGIGLEESAIAQMVEPFSAADEEGSGPGLGLAMISGFVKQCGGHISVLSEPGQGATFKIYIPEIEAGPATDLAGQDAQGPLAGWETILLAEDEDGVRSLAREVLQSHGYTVLDAGRCEAALELAKSHPGTIHLLVSDIVMPGMSGQQLAGELAALHPGVRTLFISGYAEDTVLRYGVLGPGTAILKKPFTGDALPARVRQVLDQ